MSGTDMTAGRNQGRHYEAEETLRDGTPIRIRAIRPEDKVRLLEHFAGLSEEARYFRFFGYKRALTEQDLVRLSELDFDRQVGIAATLRQGGREQFIGVGRYVRKERSSCAEAALAVLDQYQGRGIGALLIRHLARIAHCNGITQFEANVLGDNRRGLAVLAKSGCITEHSNRSGTDHFTLKCPSTSTPGGGESLFVMMPHDHGGSKGGNDASS